MKTTVIVLSLESVSGEARIALAELGQTIAFGEGFGWYYGEQKEVKYATQMCELQCFPDNRKDLLYTSGNTPYRDDRHIKYVVFNAATQLTEFRAALKRSLLPKEVKREIEGVSVVVTPENITLDTTALLSRVNQKAKEIQRVEFLE